MRWSWTIWPINHDYMMQNFECKRYEYSEQLDSVTSDDLITAAIHRKISLAATITVTPFRQNYRLMRQQGLFVVPLDINQPFVSNLAEMYRPVPDFTNTSPEPIDNVVQPDDCAAIKFVIHKDDYPRFRGDLRQMNISTETLFPDLEGEARALADIVTELVFV